MEAEFQSLVVGLPVLVLHFIVTVVMLALGIWLYTLTTPYEDFELVRRGNIAAAVSLSGATLGLALPLAFCMATSVSVLDIVLWGLVALLIQLVSYRVADWLLRDLPRRIVAGEVGAALYLVSVKLSVAALNAAAIAG